MTSMILFPEISPNIFSISLFGIDFALRWYAMAYIVGIMIVWKLALISLNKASLWRSKTAPMNADQWEDMTTWLIVGVIVGGRLGYVLFYQPAY